MKDIAGALLSGTHPTNLFCHGRLRRTAHAWALVLFSLGAASRLLAGPFIVTNTNDSGAGSLRQAILDANTSTGADTITFNIPGAGVHTIAPTSPLPAATDAVTIDGYTQPGASANTAAASDNAVLLIELNGSGAGENAAGLVIRGGASTVRGLVINRFESGIILDTKNDNFVTGNFIGTDPTGTTASPNFYGINVSSKTNLIGGVTPAARNVVSGNNANGILVSSGTTNGNVIQGNFIGIDASGQEALGNVYDGIIDVGSNTLVGGTTPGAGNVISGNGTSGVDAAVDIFAGAGSSGIIIQGNLIGTDASGAVAVGFQGTGIVTGGDSMRIGGTTPGARNVISGNTVGIAMYGRPAIQGNYIGTDLQGIAAVPNNTGIIVHNSFQAVVGGTQPGAGNVISGNREVGVELDNCSESFIQGNFIGTAADGKSPLGNGQGVILFVDNSNDTPNTAYNVVGGTSAGAGNLIAFNHRSGVDVSIGQQSAKTAHDNVIRFNSIHDNGLSGIDLGSDGVTFNDAGDADTGANNLQNFPTLESATSGNGQTTIQGYLNSTPNSRFLLDFFSNTTEDMFFDTCQGETYLGTLSVITDNAGNASFKASFANAVPVGRHITATATTTNSAPAGDTSEFSPCVTVESAPTPSPTPAPSSTPTPTSTASPTTTPTSTSTPTPTATPTPAAAAKARNLSTRLRIGPGDQQGICGFIIPGDTPKKVIIRALGPSLAQFGVSGFLADPVLELHGGAGQLIIRNDNWRDTQENAIKATDLPPLNDVESAIVATLPPGNYTAIVSGGSGVALVEVYDRDPSATASRLGNISTRGNVFTGSDVMIGGLILDGGSGAKVVVRGMGPSLAGVVNTPPLEDPTLEVHNGDGALIFSNDNWRDDPEQAVRIFASGLDPHNDNESAIAIDLAPGLYTIVLSGKNQGTGVGLLEIYCLP